MAKNLKAPDRSKTTAKANVGRKSSSAPSKKLASKPPSRTVTANVTKKNLAVSGRPSTQGPGAPGSISGTGGSSSRGTGPGHAGVRPAPMKGSKLADKRQPEKAPGPIEITVPYGDIKPGATTAPALRLPNTWLVPWGPSPAIERKDASGIPRVFIMGWEFELDPFTSSGQDIEDALGEAELGNPAWFATWAATGAHVSWNVKRVGPRIDADLRDWVDRPGTVGNVVRENYFPNGQYNASGLSLGDAARVRSDVQRRYGGNVSDWK